MVKHLIPEEARRGTKLLLRQALRQIIWETLNTHRPRGAPDIVHVGSRRSGSTLLMQVIAHAPGVKSVNQPFSVHTASAHQMRALGFPAGGAFLALSPEERARIVAYLQAMQAGEIHVQEPWRFWRKDFHFRSNRLLLKTTDASYLWELFAELGLVNVLYFRHPIPQSLSCARNNWGDKLAFFARHRAFVETRLTTVQRDLLDDLVTQGPTLERYVLGWCLENIPLFDAHAQGVPTVFYEDLVLEPKPVLAMLETVCGIIASPAMEQMVGEASVSVRNLSDASAVAAIRSGDKEALVGRWYDEISDDDRARVQAILDLFPGCVYRSNAVLPLKLEAPLDVSAGTGSEPGAGI